MSSASVGSTRGRTSSSQIRYRDSQSLTQWTKGWRVRLQLMKEGTAPIASRPNQRRRYSGLFPPLMATISFFWMPKSFISQFPTLWRSATNSLYVQVRPSKTRKVVLAFLPVAWSSRTWYVSCLSSVTIFVMYLTAAAGLRVPDVKSWRIKNLASR